MCFILTVVTSCACSYPISSYLSSLSHPIYSSRFFPAFLLAAAKTVLQIMFLVPLVTRRSADETEDEIERFIDDITEARLLGRILSEGCCLGFLQ